jgi:hypothetical protein
MKLFETPWHFHPVFSQYRGYGAVAYRDFISKATRAFMGDP